MTSALGPAELLDRVRRTNPAAYHELVSRYTEAVLAIEQDGVASFSDNNIDSDVEEQLWLLRGDLMSLLGGR